MGAVFTQSSHCLVLRQPISTNEAEFRVSREVRRPSRGSLVVRLGHGAIPRGGKRKPLWQRIRGESELPLWAIVGRRLTGLGRRSDSDTDIDHAGPWQWLNDAAAKGSPNTTPARTLAF